MDIVFTYKEGKYIDERELKYSIRSVEKNLKFNNLIVVGDRPTFLNDKAIYINARAHESTDRKNALFKHVDLKAKMMAVIADERVADDFMWCNDDMYIMQPYETFPYYYNRTIEEWHNAQDNWKIAGGKKSYRWQQYIKEIYKHFKNGKWYEVHCPIVFNKQKLLKVIEKYELHHIATIRSYYANEYKVKGIETKDYKIYNIKNFRDYKDTAPFLSTTNVTGKWYPMMNFLQDKFKNKSKYEK